MRSKITSAMMALAAMGVAAATALPPAAQLGMPGLSVPSAKKRRQVLGVAVRNCTHRRGPGPGWTHAQVQRMARKKRNVARNRSAHRG